MEISNIGILTAFSAGVISFLSPCVLPLVPGYVSYIAGGNADDRGATQDQAWSRLPAMGLSAFFVLGFSTVFVLLGASATLLGQLLLDYRNELNIAGGAIVIAFGLFMAGLPGMNILSHEFRFHLDIPGGRPVAAYVLGLGFAFGWTPCIGPILGSILAVSASTADVSSGVALLSVYSLGLGVPFLLAALFTDSLVARLKKLGVLGKRLRVFAGLVLILMGAAIITGQLSAFAYWLLDTFPALGSIG